MMLVRVIITVLMLHLAVPANAMEQNPYPFTSTVAAERFTALTKEIRCVVCQNQNIADSNAPLANDLRNKVYAMVLANQSDQSIKDYLIKRYGEFILLKPPFNQHTAILWVLPFFILLVILFSVVMLVLRQRKLSS